MAQINFKNETAFVHKQAIWDSSLFTLLITNLIAIGATLYGGWELSSILFIYWAQSVTIGFFNVKRMSALKNFRIANISMNGAAVPSTEQGKKALISFFIMHYGIFHFVYFIFLSIHSLLNGVDLVGVGITSLIFIANHYFSHKKNLEEDSKKLQSIGRLMFHPYIRIIPMHLTIILAFTLSGTAGLILFMSLKTIADLIGHIIEHADWKIPTSLSSS